MLNTEGREQCFRGCMKKGKQEGGGGLKTHRELAAQQKSFTVMV
jgi:hypothetical protein